MEQDSGVFFRRLVTDVSDAMIASDPDFVIREWNPAAEKLYGFSAIEARGVKINTLVKRKYIDETRESVLETFHRTGHWNGEVFDVTKDGRQVRVQTHVSKIHGPDSEYIGIVAVNRDITRQRQDELRKTRHSQVYRLLAEATATCQTRDKLCQFIVDRLSRVLQVTSVILQILPQDTSEKCVCHSSGSKENLTKTLTSDTIIQDELFNKGRRIMVEDLLENPPGYTWADVLKEYDYRGFLAIPIRDPDRFPIGAIYLMSSNPFLPCDCDHCHLGNFSSMIASAIHRVTSQEISLQTSNKLQAIFQHIIDVYFRISPDGVLETISPSGMTLLGIQDEKEILGRNIGDLMFATPSVYNRFLSDVLTEGKVSNYDVQVIDVNNNRLDTEINARLALDDNGKPLYIEGLMRDLTQRKQMEEELWEKEKLENMGFLVGSVAHAFNNNLTGVLGSISVAQHYSGENLKLKNFLAKAEAGCLTAKQTVQQLMLISGSIKPVCRPMRIEPVIENVVDNLSPSCQTKFAVQVDDDLPRVKGNVKQLSQVFSHILTNSVEAMQGQGQVTIKIGKKVNPSDYLSPPSASINTMLTVVVKDIGPGIPENILKRVFEPFFTTHDSSRGLGLSVSRSIVRRHEGSMYIESTIDEGTTVSVNLPIYDADMPSDTDHLGVRVLIMDSSDIVKQVFVDLMKELGHFAVGVDSGQECLKEYRHSVGANEPYDVVFIDLGAADSNSGTSVLKMIRRVNPDVYTVATSGYSDHPVLTDYQLYGFNGFLLKPFRLSAVEGVLETLTK